MARSKRFPTAVVAAVLVTLLFVALNPGQEDFKNWYQARAAASVKKQVQGTVGNLVAGISKGAAGIAASASFRRHNLLVASVYSRGGDTVAESYLGIAKLFIKLK